MIKGKLVVAVIPARGGSKRLPGKNMLPFHGEPLIAHTIKAGNKSEFIDKVVVSSDSQTILDYCDEMGICSYKRPQGLAEDTSTSIDVALDVLEHFPEFDVLVWLQPTSPLRLNIDIDSALKLYIEKNAESVVSVCEAAHSPLWMSTLSENSKLESFISYEATNKRSQDLETYYLLNGAIYITRIDSFRNDKAFLTKNSYAYIMPQERSVDIDTAFDFKLAELMYLETNS